MIFCIFSFNRGKFLQNCIQSIEACATNSTILIFDDNSNDPETIKVLESAKQNHTVIQPGHKSGHHLGGLYGNMQSALEYCKDEELVCYLQDDTQMVRKITESDESYMNDLFKLIPELGFIHPCFIRGINKLRGAKYLYDPKTQLYFRSHTTRSTGRYFSALLIMKPSRLASVNWEFQGSEPNNSKQAEKLFLPMGYLFSPFAMWLPEAPAYRGKRKTLGLKLAERKRGCGFYPFKTLTAEQTQSLNSRPTDLIPYAEDFLECTTVTPPKPWAYNPLTGTGWIKVLNQLELKLRKITG